MDYSRFETLTNGFVFATFLSLLIASPQIIHGAQRVEKAKRNDLSQGGSEPKPCCLPTRFQAIITNLPSFSAQTKQVTHLYRDWEQQLQIQEDVLFTGDGIATSIRKVIMDYKNMIQYVVDDKDLCQKAQIDSGMLEPCMPDDSKYLGKSYIGQYGNQAHFDGWYFQRKDKNRNIEMIIAVTSDRCIPISERITGTLGRNPVDVLVLFTNLTEVVPESAFKIPDNCVDMKLM